MPSTTTKDDVTDPTDWHNLPSALTLLEGLDSSLRCDICKDFYTSPVITSCNHTFCSLCIRRCLAAEGRCPSCRTSEQESRLRKNGAVMEVVDAFSVARSGLLDLGRSLRGEGGNEPAPPADRILNDDKSLRGKRKRDEVEESQEDVRPARRTRSQCKSAIQNGQMSTRQADEPIVVELDERDAQYTPTSTASPRSAHAKHREFDVSDGLVACPICSQRMKEEAVSAHLDTACPGFSTTVDSPPSSNQYKSSTLLQAAPTAKPSRPPPERLPQLSYSLFNDVKLRKKLLELGIPSFGNRQLLQRRHAEWLALWNANCDAKDPKSRRALLQELDTWERSQGGNSRYANGEGGRGEVMEKEFDGKGWAKKNKDDFNDLVFKARKNRGKGTEQKRIGEVKEGDQPEVQDVASNDTISTYGAGSALTVPSPDHVFNRALTAPPSTDALPNSLLATTPATEEPPAVPSLTKHLSIAEHPPSNRVGSLNTINRSDTPIRPSISKSRPADDIPPPASMMWTHSSTGGESAGTAPAIATTELPPISVGMHSPVARNDSSRPSSRNGAESQDSAREPRPISIDVRGARRASVFSASGNSRTETPVVNTFRKERKESGSGNADPPVKLPMFQVPSHNVVDGDGTGVR